MKKLGIKRQDRVFFFLQRSPELYVGFLGAIKYGAIASPMFPAFGPDAIRDRLLDSGAVAWSPTATSRRGSTRSRTSCPS